MCRTPDANRFSPELPARRTRESEYLHYAVNRRVNQVAFKKYQASFPNDTAPVPTKAALDLQFILKSGLTQLMATGNMTSATKQ